MECLRPRQNQSQNKISSTMYYLLCTILHLVIFSLCEQSKFHKILVYRYILLHTKVNLLKPSIERIDTFCRKSFDHMIVSRVFKLIRLLKSNTHVL